MHTQRNIYKKGKMLLERVLQLEGVGFKWSQRNSYKCKAWEERFDELVAYKEKNGNCNVPQRQGALGLWVGTQCANYKEGKMSQKHVSQLEGVGFIWRGR